MIFILAASAFVLLAIFALSVIASETGDFWKPKAWWLLRLSAIPTISVFTAAWYTVFPLQNPPNYDPMAGGDAGPTTFLVVLVFGLLVPVIYTAVIAPILITYAIWQNRK